VLKITLNISGKEVAFGIADSSILFVVISTILIFGFIAYIIYVILGVIK